MFKLFNAAVLAVVCCATAHGSVLSSSLTFNGREDQLSTTNPAGLAKFVDVNGDGAFSVGDVVYGFVVADAGTNDYQTGGTPINMGGGYSVAMFSGQLAAGTGGFNLIAPVASTADLGAGSVGLRLKDLLSPTLASNLVGSIGDNAIAAVFSGFKGSATEAFSSANNATGRGLDFFTSANFKYDFALGSSPVAPGFFQFTGISSLFFPNTVGAQRGGFSVIDRGTDWTSTVFKDVLIASLFSPPSVTSASVALDTTFVNLTNESAITRGWSYQTQSDGVRLNVVPEPASLLAFAGLFGFGIARWKRKV